MEATRFEIGNAIHGQFGDQPPPPWYNKEHHVLYIENVDLEGRNITLSSESTWLTISLVELQSGTWWKVEWFIRHSYNERVQGTVVWDTEDLGKAFCLNDIYRSVSNRSSFIREHGYLNIPCAGTGYDGDPNLSLEVTTGMQEAVRQLIASL